jgi:cbb3-type cytochrome oxidase maturation protein
MSISYLLVLLGLGLLGAAVWALFWAVDDGQYDDLEAHGRDALEDENGDILHFPAKGDGPG